MGEHQLEVYLMNTGRVGGADDVEGSKKVRIKHSSAIVKGDRRGHDRVGRATPTSATRSPRDVPGIEDSDAACCARGALRVAGPRRRLRQDRRDAEVGAREYLKKYPALSDEIVDAVR